MDTVQIEFEPFIDEAARQFIVNGLDMHNIAATALPDYCPVNFVLLEWEGDKVSRIRDFYYARYALDVADVYPLPDRERLAGS